MLNRLRRRMGLQNDDGVPPEFVGTGFEIDFDPRIESVDGEEYNEWIAKQVRHGWEIIDQNSGYVALQRPGKGFKGLLWRLFLLGRTECKAIAETPRGETFVAGPVSCEDISGTVKRWWIPRDEPEQIRIPGLGSHHGTFFTEQGQLKMSLEDDGLALMRSIDDLIDTFIIRNSSWVLVPYVARINIEELYSVWNAGEILKDRISPMDLAKLVIRRGGTIRGNFITGVMWKQRHDWYEGVVGPVIKWILLIIGGSAAIISVVFSILRFLNESPIP